MSTQKRNPCCSLCVAAFLFSILFPTRSPPSLILIGFCQLVVLIYQASVAADSNGMLLYCRHAVAWKPCLPSRPSA